MEQELRVRVISWNLHHRVEPAAAEEAALIAELSPDIACLQEVNVNSITVLEAKSGVALLTAPAPHEVSPPRRSAYNTVVAGGSRTTARELPRLDVPFPERVASAVVTVEGAEVTVASYHAPLARSGLSPRLGRP